MSSSSNRFVHLHTHTEYSALDGLIRVPDAFSIANEHGQSAMAITDHGTLGGMWKAQYEADKNGVKLIPGMEAYLAYGDRNARYSQTVAADDTSDDSDTVDGESAATKERKYEHLTLLAASPAGWRNLILIHNAAEDSKWGKYPRIDYELLAAHREGIIVLTGCLGGPILGPLSRGNKDEAEENLVRIIATVGRENVYVEVMEHGIAVESAILPDAAALAAKHGITLVATNDAHYARAEDALTHEAWLAVRSQKVLSDPKRYHFHGEGFHLRTEQEMLALRPEGWWAEAVTNTGLVADRVADRVLPRSSPKLPKFPTPDGFTDNLDYFMSLVRDGAKLRYGDTMPDEVRARLNEELNVVRPMGFIDYFLVVHDLTSWARVNDILVGPGRGSAAGSMISYCLFITGIDPIENDLLFERFLEPGRSDFPDIDVDFEGLRRTDILDYLQERWGSDNVALIGSWGAAKTKRAIKDAARVLEQNPLGARLAKLIPVEQGNPLSFELLMDESRSDAAAFRKELSRAGEDGEKVLELARGFDNAVNGASIHACGIVISDTPLTDLIPMRRHATTGRLITEWDSKDVEKFGLLKLDVLSLRNLDIASQAVKFIAETTGEIIDIDNLPHPNSKGNPQVDAAWKLLQAGRTSGIFQMESPAMANLSRQVQPENLTELSAVIALFRPGPLSAGMDQHFALRKHGQEAIDYGIFTQHPAEQDAIAGVLAETYGGFVFQEQLMRLGSVIAGFDAAGRSQLRKAVGKKDKDLMDTVGEAFRKNATVEFTDDDGNVTSPVFEQATADRIWEMMKGSASYLFNASHSAAYAQLAYVTAYLKGNWPAAYGAAILAVTDQEDKRIEAIRALLEEGITIFGPDVNRSKAHSSPEGSAAVRIGLSEIKDVGQAGERIVETREAANGSGAFTSFYDIVNRARRGGTADPADRGYLPSNQITALIEAGALDDFGPRMGLTAVARIVALDSQEKIVIPPIEWGVIERSARERRRLLLSLGENPLHHFQSVVKAWNRPGPRMPDGGEFISPATPIASIPMTDGTVVTTIGVLSKFSEGAYRGGRRANITLEGSLDSISGVMWDTALTTAKLDDTIPPLGWLVAASGKVSVREFEQEGEDGEITVLRLKELRVNQLFPVKVEDPVRGSIPPSGMEIPTFGVQPEPEPAADMPEPMFSLDAPDFHVDGLVVTYPETLVHVQDYPLPEPPFDPFDGAEPVYDLTEPAFIGHVEVNETTPVSAPAPDVAPTSVRVPVSPETAASGEYRHYVRRGREARHGLSPHAPDDFRRAISHLDGIIEPKYSMQRVGLYVVMNQDRECLGTIEVLP